MNAFFDKIINTVKWPIALLALLSTPAYVQSFSYFNFASVPFFALLMGFCIFFIIKSMFDKEFKASIEIIGHEFIHAFFAMLTFHKVKKINLNDDNSGGSMSFEGEGNWLIIIGPYFFPLSVLVIMLIISVYKTYFPVNNWTIYGASAFLGFILAYHTDVVTSQIHDKQTDLPKVGYRFCAMFLPSANLWAIGSVLAYNSKGWIGILQYQNLIHYLNMQNLAKLLQFF